MEYGVKVKPHIEAAEIDAEALRKAIQEALDEHTKTNPIVVKDFTATKDAKKAKTLRSAIQTALDNATKENKIMVKHVGVKILSDDKKKIISTLNSELKDKGITIKVNKIDANDAVKKFRDQLTNMLSGLSITGLKDFLGTEGVEEVYQKAADGAAKAANAQGNLTKKTKETNAEIEKLGQMKSVLGTAYKSLFEFNDASVRVSISDQIKAALELIKKAQSSTGDEQIRLTLEIEETVAAIRKEVEAHKEVEAAAKKKAKAIRDAGGEEAYAAQQARKAAAEEAKIAKQQEASAKKEQTHLNKILALRKKIEKAYGSNKSGFDRLGGDKIQSWIKDLNQDASISDDRIRSITEEFEHLNATVMAASAASGSLFGRISTLWDKLKGFYASIKGMSFVINGFRQMWSAVKDLDAAMTELKKVTNLTAKGYANFQKDAAAMAKQIGASISDTVNATADFARLGFNVNDSKKLAEAALVYKNVGDGINDVSTATESLISTIKAFQDFGYAAEDAMFIVDKFNEVGNNFAISSSGIGEALRRSAAALAAAGNDLDQSIGLITGMNAVVQDPDVVGTALKTISMYLRAAKTDAEAAGIETEGMANSVSELRKELMQLTGIDIMIDNDTFKSTFEIMRDLSEVWSDLTSVSQANVLELIGGKRNGNIITSLLTNFDDAIEAMESAQDALGSVSTENAKYLDSINGKLTKIKASFEELSSTVLNSELLKFVLDAVNGLITLTNWLAKIHALIPVIILGFSAFKTFKLADTFMSVAKAIKGMVSYGANLKTIAKTISSFISEMSDSQKNALVSFLGSSGITRSLMSLSGETRSTVLEMIGLKTAVEGASSAGAAATTTVGGMQVAMSAAGTAATGLSAALIKLSKFALGVIVAIQAVSWVYREIVETFDKANEKVQELESSYKSTKETADSNIKSLKSLKGEYEKLSAGVDEQGNNVKLTADEYDRYCEIISQIAEYAPSLVSGYDEERVHLTQYKDVIKDAIAEQEKYISNHKEMIIQSGQTYAVKWHGDYDNAMLEYELARDQLDRALFTHDRGDQNFANGVYQDVVESALKDIIPVQNILSDIGNLSIKDAQKILQYKDIIISTLQQSGAYTESQINAIKQSFRELNSVFTGSLNDLSTSIENYFMTLIEVDGMSRKTFDHLSSIGALDELKNGIFDIYDDTKTYEQNASAMLQYADAYTELVSAAANAGVLSMPDTFLEDGALDDTEILRFNAAIDNLKEKFGDNIAWNSALEFFESLLNHMRRAGDGSEELDTRVTGLADALQGMSKTKDVLEQAKSDMTEYGTLTMDTIQSVVGMLGENENLGDYIETTADGVSRLGTIVDEYGNTITTLEDRSKSVFRNDIQSLKNQNILLEREAVETFKQIQSAQAYINQSDGYDPSLFVNIQAAQDEIDSLTKSLNTNGEAFQSNERLIRIYESILGDFGDSILSKTEIQERRKKAEQDATALAEIYQDAYNSINLATGEIDPEKQIDLRNKLIDIVGIDEAAKYFDKNGLPVLEKIREEALRVLTEGNVDTTMFNLIMATFDLDEAKAEIVGKLQDIASWYRSAVEDMKDGFITDPDIYTNAKEYFGGQLDSILKATPDGKGYELIEQGLFSFRDTMIETAGITGPLAAMILGMFAKDPDVSGLEKLTSAIGKVSSIKSLMDTIDTELADSGTNTLDTLGKFIDAYGEGWEEHVNFDNGINITAEALRKLALAGIEELEIEEAQKQKLREVAETSLSAAAANKELKDSYEGLKTAVSTYGEIGSAQELTYETIKGLIDVDSQYAKAIEYQNGRLQLNKDKFDEVTEAVKRKALADAEAKAQAILAGDEYQKLIAKMNTEGLTGPEQDRLDSLNAQVMAFHVLESEIDNSTSALQRFLNATDRVNAVTYDGAKDAYQTIKDVLYNKDSDMYGMVGHEKFEEALKLMISPDIEVDSAEFKKQFKVIERYFGQETSALGMDNFYKDMIKKGIIDRATGVINTTVEEAAKTLNMTENAFRFAIDQYNQYEFKENQIDIGGKTTPKVEEETGLNQAIKNFEELKTQTDEFQKTPIVIPVDPSLENINAMNTALGITEDMVAKLSGTPIDVKLNLPDNITREQLGEIMNQMYGTGNVVMTERPKVTLDDGSIATLLSETFGAGDQSENEKYDFQYDKNVVINATPILPDGTIIDGQAFRDYIGGLVDESAKTGKSILDLDTKGVVINVTPVFGDLDAAYQSAGNSMNFLHMLQEAYFSDEMIDESVFAEQIKRINRFVHENGISVIKSYQKTVDEAGRTKMDTAGTEEPLNAISGAAAKAKENVDSTKMSADAMQEAVNKINETPLDISVKGTLDGLGQVYIGLLEIIKKLKEIDNIEAIADVTVKQSTTAGTIGSAIGGAIGNLVGGLFGKSGDAQAGGTNKAAGGKTLVGELGPEIAVDPEKNRWYVVGANGPEFVNLPKNAIVFNADQTRSLFANGRTRQRGEALASGTRTASKYDNGSVVVKTNEPIYNLIIQNIKNPTGTGQTIPESDAAKVVSSNEKVTGNTQGNSRLNSSGKSSGSGGGSSSSSKEDEMTVLEKLEEKYQKLLETQEHLIEHQEFLYRQAEKGLDYKGMETSLQKQVEIYKDLMAEAQKGISEMVANGASDTDEELQNMERAYWDAWDSMYETLEEIATLYVEALQEKMDGIQGAYADFAKAADELAESGGISVDTFQSLIENGVQYMSLLEKVNGQYVINEDGINKLVAAEKKRLAVESALSYLMQVQQAINDKDTYLLENLANVSNRIGQSSWDAVYAQAALLKNLGLSDDQYAAVLENINALKAISENVTSDITADAEKASDKTKNGLEDQQDALDEILKLTQDLIEHETEERIDAIEEEIDAYRKIIDLKKEALETTRDENDYMDSVAEKTAEIAKLQAQMDQLSLDDSREAEAERAAIAEQLKELQKELSDMQEDHSYDAQVDALDKQANAYEESRQQEIADLENSISSAEKLYQTSIDRLNTGWGTLYKELISWNTEVGNSLNTEITDAWERAAEAVKLYGSYSAAIKGLEYKAENGGGKNIIVTNKVPTFHSGGVVGGATSKDGEEVLALLESGEIVIERDGQKHLYEIIDFQTELSKKLGKQIGQIDFSSLTMNPTTGAVPAAEIVNTTNNNDSKSFVFNPQIDVKINHSGNMTGRDAKSFGRQIASTVADELLNTFEASGFMGSMRTRLRQA